MSKRTKKKSKSKRKVSKKSKSKRKVSKKSKSKTNIENNQELVIKLKSEWIKKALFNKTEYEKKYKKSLKNNDEFWKKEGKRITWIKPYKKIKNIKYSKSDVRIKWY